jgi:hypothetical protein
MKSSSISYDQLFKISSLKEQILILDFQSIEFLSVFEITELFAFCLLQYRFSQLEIRGHSPVVDYLTRINFFSHLANARQVSGFPPHQSTGQFERLGELLPYSYKEQFYGQAGTILTVFRNPPFGLTEKAASLLLANVSEIVDNAFYHNLGQWELQEAPRAVLLMQKYPKSHRLEISLCDFGVGFLRTLRRNYPQLNSEAEAIEKGIQASVTGDANPRRGNGLFHLRKHVFNGRPASLLIRSTDTLMNISKEGNVNILNQGLPYRLGVNIGIQIEYQP